MAEASSQFVFLEDLKKKLASGSRSGAESAMVTTGAGQEKIRRLPELTGMKSEVPIRKRRDGPHAVLSSFWDVGDPGT